MFFPIIFCCSSVEAAMYGYGWWYYVFHYYFLWQLCREAVKVKAQESIMPEKFVASPIIVRCNGPRQGGCGYGAGGRTPQHDEVPRIMNGKKTLLHSGGTIGLGKQRGRLYPAVSNGFE